MIVEAEARDAGKRLDAFLHERLSEFSRSRLQSWIKEQRVQVDGAPARASYLMRGGEAVAVSPADLPPLRAEAEELPLVILYEDSDVILVDKPAGMVVHAGAGHARGTLVNALLHRFGALSQTGGELRPGIVHRLDKETSGVMVVARTDRAHQALARQFHDREVEKVYLALVHGRMKQAQGRVVKPIARDPVRRIRMTARLENGRAALTEYTRLEEFERFTYLDVRIGTGRTHQIRVHMRSIGHPLVGDTAYGGAAFERLYLHAYALALAHPRTHAPLRVSTPPPPPFVALVPRLTSPFS